MELAVERRGAVHGQGRERDRPTRESAHVIREAPHERGRSGADPDQLQVPP